MSASRGRVVYSTGSAGPQSACPGCGDDPCACAERPVKAPAEHAVRVRRERGGRRGKTVTIAGPLMLRRADAAELLRRLKHRCGSGGTLKLAVGSDGERVQELELQGDHVEVVLACLLERGFPSRRSGG